MSKRKQKQIAGLVKIREFRESKARRELQNEMSALRTIHTQAKEKKALVKELTTELYEGLEDRFIRHSSTSDVGTAFSTFAMSVNAARENLLLEEGLETKLNEELVEKRSEVSGLRVDVKATFQQLKKAKTISEKLTREIQRQNERLEEAAMEEIANAQSIKP